MMLVEMPNGRSSIARDREAARKASSAIASGPVAKTAYSASSTAQSARVKPTDCARHHTLSTRPREARSAGSRSCVKPIELTISPSSSLRCSSVEMLSGIGVSANMRSCALMLADSDELRAPR